MSNQTVEGNITKVFDPQEGTRRPWNILVEQNGGGEVRYSTFKKEIADVARANIGSRGVVTFRVELKDGYDNRYFEGFEKRETLDDAIVANINSGNTFRNPVHPTEQASIHRAVALQRAAEHLQWLPEDERTMSSVKALYAQYLEILEGK